MDAYTYVKFFEFKIAIDLQPPFSNITRAQSVYFLATALCSTVSPSSSTALGSAPANSNSCNFSTRILNKYSFIKEEQESEYYKRETYSHTIWLAMIGTHMSNRWAKAISQPRPHISISLNKTTDTFWGSSC